MSKTELFDTKYTTADSINELSSTLNEPEWLLQRRQKAFEEYKKLPFDKDTLFYKYTSFRDFDPKKLEASWQTETKSLLNESSIVLQELEPDLIETEDGISTKLPEELVKQGVIFDSLHNLLETDEELAKKIVNKATSYTKEFDKLGALARAFATNITVLYVPKNVILDKPLVKVNTKGEGSTATFSEFIAYFEESSQASYIDVFLRSEKEPADKQLYVGIETTYVADNAHVKSAQIQDWNKSTLHIMARMGLVERYGKYRTMTQLQGGYMSRLTSNILLNGDGSEGYDLFVSFGDENQRFDVKSELHHIARSTIGQTHARQVMMDRSESILRGLIVIPETGVEADSWLTSQGLTIGKGKVTAIPALQIDQNDVKAAHAASVEPLNDDLLFYLESRGIPRKDAREMLVKGYFEYVLKRLEQNQIMDLSRKYLAKKWDIAQKSD